MSAIGKNRIRFIKNSGFRATGALILILGLVLLPGCTGVNILSSNGITGNTNPAPEYSYVLPTYYYGKGGVMYHNNTVAGQIGFNATSKKRGEACAYSILFAGAVGDASIETAKKNGKITKVQAVEFNNFAILGVIYHSHCTVVMGE